MGTHDWDEPEGEEPNGPSGPFELDWRRLFGEDHPLFDDSPAEDESHAPRDLNEKQVRVVGIYEQRASDNQMVYFVLVRDHRDRELRIYIGQHEAYSIHVAMENRGFVRPLTHDLSRILIEKLGWAVERVIVDDEYKGIYYAKLCLLSNTGCEPVEIDCRPSDAIAIAVRCQAPIFVAESVFEAEIRKEQEL
ncbi:MAG: bifunctional nuclease family protein [Armatimonadetes bacterium]|jgi:bifunctional DNase/RNase|nr:bifunctional nuclease family protein [Armatimonadota bacterium]